MASLTQGAVHNIPPLLAINEHVTRFICNIPPSLIAKAFWAHKQTASHTVNVQWWLQIKLGFLINTTIRTLEFENIEIQVWISGDSDMNHQHQSYFSPRKSGCESDWQEQARQQNHQGRMSLSSIVLSSWSSSIIIIKAKFATFPNRVKFCKQKQKKD